MSGNNEDLPAVLDLARGLTWIAVAISGYLSHERAIDFVCRLSKPDNAAMLGVAALRFADLDPGELDNENPITFAGQTIIPIRKKQAVQHWDKAWDELRNAAQRSKIEVRGRPQGRSGAHMEIIPALEFGQLVRMQGDDGISRLAMRGAIDQYWDRIEVLTADILLLWPIVESGQVEEVQGESGPSPAAAPGVSRIPRRRGPTPVLRLAIEQAMREAVQGGFDLENEKEEVLADRFGASRYTCRAARANVLSEINTDKHRQTSPNDK